MFKKVVFLFVVFFVVQVFFSCHLCRCGDPGKYENTYHSASLGAMDTSGFQSKEVSDTVYKSSFGLTLAVNFDSELVAQERKWTTLGFSAAYACSCEDPQYIYVDPIDCVDLFVRNVQTNDVFKVTDSFRTRGYGGEMITLNELFENREEWHDGFQFELTEFDSIPNSSIFIVEVYLKSGIKLADQTNQINFF